MRTAGTAGDLWKGLAGRWPCTEPGPFRTNHGVLTGSYQELGFDPVLPICCLLLLFWQNKKPWKLQENKENLRNLKTWKVLPVPETHREERLRATGLSCLGASQSWPTGGISPSAHTPAGPPGFQVERCEPKGRGRDQSGAGTHYLQYRRERHRRSTPSGTGRPPAPYWEGPQCRLEFLQDTEHTPWGPRLSRGSSGMRVGTPWKGIPGLGARRLTPGIPSGPSLQVPGNRKQS